MPRSPSHVADASVLLANGHWIDRRVGVARQLRHSLGESKEKELQLLELRTSLTNLERSVQDKDKELKRIRQSLRDTSGNAIYSAVAWRSLSEYDRLHLQPSAGGQHWPFSIRALGCVSEYVRVCMCACGR